MKIYGINVSTEFGEPSLNTWISDVKAGALNRLSLTDPKLAEDIIKSVTDAYHEAESFNPEPYKFSVDNDGKIILPAGCLVHLTPIKRAGEINYDKLRSIKKRGLLSLGLFENGESWDEEVPYQVSFHRCAKQQTIPEKYKAMCDKSHHNKVYDLGVIIDAESEGIQKLLAFDTSRHRPNDNIDTGNGYKNPKNGEFYAFRLKQYPELIKTEAQKQALGLLIDHSHPVVEGEDFAYLPIAVPPQYIAGFILNEEQEKNNELIAFLQEEFPNATLCSYQGGLIAEKAKIPEREF